MAKVHNLAFDYSAYDNAQEAEAQRAIKYKKNPALKQKTVSVVAVIGICLLVAVVLGTMIYGRVEISSLCSEQTRQEEQLAQLQGENVSCDILHLPYDNKHRKVTFHYISPNNFDISQHDVFLYDIILLVVTYH